MRMRLAALLLAAAIPGLVAAASSPYADDVERDIKALSPEEVAGLLAGRGMGLAKAAELNGYPGPKHVLELADELALDPEQRSRTEALFRHMRTRAVAVGRALVEAEGVLDGRFARRSIVPGSLKRSLERIADLEAELRRVHLEAHLEQRALLSDAQVAAYRRGRGYCCDDPNDDHDRHRQH